MRSCTQCLSPYTQDVEFCGIDGTQLIETDADPLVGNDIDRYRILQHIGDGGMARVYRARHHVLDREVAVKVLFGEYASNKTIAERFRREAQTISRIEHENIVGVTDFGRTPQGLTFLAMELVRGQTVRRMVKARGPLEPALVARVTRQIALGLGAAHDQGFVHRDLKPGNVMVVGEAPDEIVKILDFGLARMADEDNEMYLTRTGQFLGTPIYMSPEQIVGADVDLRADLYSLGVMMFEMLEGHPPFTGTKLAQIREKHLSERPARVRPAGGLEDVVAMLLAKRPEERPTSARAVVATLDALTGDPNPTDVLPAVGVLDAATTQRMPFPDTGASQAVVVDAVHDAGPTREIGKREPDTDEQPSAAIAEVLEDESPERAPLPRAPNTRTRSGIRELDAVVAGSNGDWEEGPTVAAHGAAPIAAQSLPAVESVTETPALERPRSGRRTFAVAFVTAGVAVVTGLAVARAINGAPAERPPPSPVASAPERETEREPTDETEPTTVAEVAEDTETRAAPRKRRGERRATRRRHAQRVDAALAERGLLRADLGSDEASARAYDRWRSARKQSDPRAWQKSTDALVAAIRAYPVGPAVLDRRLKHIASRLQAASERVPNATLRPLEDRYLAIASEVRSGMSESNVHRALGRANALSASIEQTLGRAPR